MSGWNGEALRQQRAGRWGSSLEVYSTIDSTNRRAGDWVREGAIEGSVVLADSQTGGRGRLQREWFSPPGVNLYLTVVLRPSFSPTLAPLVSLAAAVAGCRALKQLGVPCGIKWPNDLLAGPGRQKVGGILSELRTDARGIEGLVVGIGINVLPPPEGWPAGLHTATSASEALGKPVDRQALLFLLLDELEIGYECLTSGRVQHLLDAWRSDSWTLGQQVRYEWNGAWLEGTAVDIDAAGGLLVSGPTGQATITAGDVSLVGLF